MFSFNSEAPPSSIDRRPILDFFLLRLLRFGVIFQRRDLIDGIVYGALGVHLCKGREFRIVWGTKPLREGLSPKKAINVEYVLAGGVLEHAVYPEKDGKHAVDVVIYGSVTESQLWGFAASRKTFRHWEGLSAFSRLIDSS